MAHVIAARGITKRYGDLTALDSVDLTLVLGAIAATMFRWEDQRR